MQNFLVLTGPDWPSGALREFPVARQAVWPAVFRMLNEVGKSKGRKIDEGKSRGRASGRALKGEKPGGGLLLKAVKKTLPSCASGAGRMEAALSCHITAYPEFNQGKKELCMEIIRETQMNVHVLIPSVTK